MSRSVRTSGAACRLYRFPYKLACLAQTSPQNAAGDLGGTSWQLVKFQSSDEKTLIPDDKAKYTIAFETDGRVSARIDCNRGMGTWKSSGLNRLQFGPLALTARCARPDPSTIASPRTGSSYGRELSRMIISSCR